MMTGLIVEAWSGEVVSSRVGSGCRTALGGGAGVNRTPVAARGPARPGRARAEPRVEVLHGAPQQLGLTGPAVGQHVGRDERGIGHAVDEVSRATGQHAA